MEVIFNVEMNIHEKGSFLNWQKSSERDKGRIYDATMWHVCNAWINMTPKILLCMLTLKKFMTSQILLQFYKINWKKGWEDFLINGPHKSTRTIFERWSWSFLNNFLMTLLEYLISTWNWMARKVNRFGSKKVFVEVILRRCTHTYGF